jgi:hypothetical protein
MYSVSSQYDKASVVMALVIICLHERLCAGVCCSWRSACIVQHVMLYAHVRQLQSAVL